MPKNLRTLPEAAPTTEPLSVVTTSELGGGKSGDVPPLLHPANASPMIAREPTMRRCFKKLLTLAPFQKRKLLPSHTTNDITRSSFRGRCEEGLHTSGESATGRTPVSQSRARTASISA